MIKTCKVTRGYYQWDINLNVYNLVSVIGK